MFSHIVIGNLSASLALDHITELLTAIVESEYEAFCVLILFSNQHQFDGCVTVH